VIGCNELRSLASALGFCDAGAAVARPGQEGRQLDDFVRRGRHAGMAWLARDTARRADPAQVLPGVRSVVVVAAAYPFDDGRGAGGSIARYGRLADYHDALLPGVQRLAEALGGRLTRAYVDTGPVMEKVWAQRAGIGWIGRQTHLVSRRHGCWTLLGVVLTGAEVEPSAPQRDLCGRCVRCIEACPTGALQQQRPYEIDARRCRSYLTIEHRGELDEQQRRWIGDALFGCDLCLDACPWNRFAGGAAHPALRSRLPARLDPTELLSLDSPAFRQRFGGTPVLRARRRGLLRNAAVVLGNAGDPAAAPYLRRCAAEESDPVVRQHAEWALADLSRRA